MSFHLYKTRIKCLCRNYDTVFWSFGFPLLLAIFFYMGFYNLSGGESIDAIPIAIVLKNNSEDGFMKAAETARIEEGRNLFLVQSATLEDAKKMLREDKIAGYIVYADPPTLFIKKNGIEQTILKSFLDNYVQMNRTAENIIALDPEAANNGLPETLNHYRDYVVDGGDSDRNPNYTLIYFYTLIALACMFGANWGFREMVDIQADQSAVGARINVSPVHKLRLLLCNLLAVFTLHFISILFLLTFLNKVLGIDFGRRIGMILLTCVLGPYAEFL